MNAAFVLAGLLAATPALADEPPPLAALLDTAGRYVRGFENDFATVVSDETYQQHDRTTRKVLGINRTSTATRALRSELLFLWLADAHEWLSVRNVLSVDRQLVPDSHERLERMLADPTPNAAGRFRGLRDESARFNIGAIRRNYNDPLLPLQVLDPVQQPRFQFTLAGSEVIGQVTTWKIARTELALDDPAAHYHFVMRVAYGRDAKLAGWVPIRMDETYTYGREVSEERFETSGRILPRE